MRIRLPDPDPVLVRRLEKLLRTKAFRARLRAAFRRLGKDMARKACELPKDTGQVRGR